MKKKRKSYSDPFKIDAVNLLTVQGEIVTLDLRKAV
jgi:transposase-like protein